MNVIPGAGRGVVAIRSLPAGQILYDVEGNDKLLTYDEALAALHQPRSGYLDPLGEHLARSRLDGNAAYPVDALVSLDRGSYRVLPTREGDFGEEERIRWVERARELAVSAHAGQLDKAQVPYIEHVAWVASHCEPNSIEQIVAWLHDVVEDTPVTLDDLRAEFPEVVVEAVDAITARPGEARELYYERVRSNDVALVVKHVDVNHNSSPERLAVLPGPERKRLQAKYDRARAALAR